MPAFSEEQARASAARPFRCVSAASRAPFPLEAAEPLRTPRGGARESTAPAAPAAPAGETSWQTLTWFQRPDKYEGEVVDGHMHGKGTYTHADGSTYTGGFARSQREGYGEYSFADGSAYRGTFHITKSGRTCVAWDQATFRIFNDTTGQL